MKIPSLTYKQRNLKSPEGFELLYLPDLFSRGVLPGDHDPFKHHRHGFYAILIITDGEVNHVVDFGINTLKKDYSMIIAEGQIHAFDQDSKYEGYLVLFTEEFVQKYMAQSTIFLINSLYNYFIGQNVFYTPVVDIGFVQFVASGWHGSNYIQWFAGDKKGFGGLFNFADNQHMVSPG